MKDFSLVGVLRGDNPAPRYRPQATYPALQGVSLLPRGFAHIGNQRKEN